MHPPPDSDVDAPPRPAAGKPESPESAWRHTRRGSAPLAELATRITELAGHLNAAQHRWLVLIAEFDRREGWADGATQSCAHWLSWKCGLNLGAAREKVRVARALETLPLISAAMARGALSYSKVRALTRVATPQVEQALLMLAEHSSADHVETLVRQYRHAQEAAELSREAMQVANRGLRYFFDDDGSLVLQVRLAAESGALVLRALDQALASHDDQPDVPSPTSGRTSDGLDQAHCADSDRSVQSQTSRSDSGSARAFDATAPAATITQRRADALVRFAESYLSHGLKALGGGERHQIVVHVSAETLGHHAPGQCNLENGPALAAETVRRMACDASIVTITEDAAGNLLDIGRKTRNISPALARALRSRDGGCRFPGCTHKRFVDGHHIHHWADGGHTRLSNLVLLCRFHHRQLHEGRFSVQRLDDGALRFYDADGETLDVSAPTMGNADHSVNLHHRRSVDTRPGPEAVGNFAPP